MKMIAAVDRNWGIGYKGELLTRISSDLKNFKTLTMGGTVILGRKTIEGFPGARPLPGRKNIVLSRNKELDIEGAMVVHSIEELKEALAGQESDKVFVLGGASVYEQLLQLVGGKDYFVITTNVDHCFQKAGFGKKRLFYTQGDYGLFQCSGPCRQETYDNEAAVREMLARQKDLRIPSELVPVCPHCGRPMTMNLRCDDTFVEDVGWHAAAERYANFLRTRAGQKILFLELGVGYNTPGIIKYPFRRMAEENPNAVYASINLDEDAPAYLGPRSILPSADIGTALQSL